IFSDDGKYLYFVSARNQNPAFSAAEFNFATLKPDGIYVTTLEAKTPSPFAPQEASATESSDHSGKHSGNQNKHKNVKVKIDFRGLAQRAVALPVPTANIGNLAESNGVVYYSSAPNPVLGKPLPNEQPDIMAFDMAKRENKTI